MSDAEPQSDPSTKRLVDPDAVIEVLRNGQVDAVVGNESVAVLRVAEVERKLRNREARLNVALDACGGGIFEYSLPLDESTYFGERWSHILGYQPGELPRPTEFPGWFLNRLHPEDRPGFERVYSDFISGRTERYRQEMRVRHKDEYWIWVAIMAQATRRGDRGEVTRLVGIMFDIGSRKKGDEELRTSRAAALNMMEDALVARRAAEEATGALAATEEQFRIVVENSRDGIYRIDLTTGRYAFMSPSQEQMLGYGLDEMAALTPEAIADRVHPDDRAFFLSYREHVAAGYDPTGFMEYRWKRKDGEYRWLSDNRKTVRDDNGAPLYLVGTTRDVTERKRVDAELRDLNLTLEERVAERTAIANQRIRQLQNMATLLAKVEERERLQLSHVLHDGLQQLLVAVRLRLDRVRRVRDDSEKFSAALSEMDSLLLRCVAECRQLSHELVPDVPEAGTLRQSLEVLREEKQAKHGLTVHLDAPEDLSTVSRDLAGFLFRTLRELLFNVVKHAGVLEAELAVHLEGDRLVATVRDKGRGFNMSLLDQTVGDRGIGLLGMRQRVELLGGELHVESAPGQGCTVQVRMPSPNDARREDG